MRFLNFTFIKLSLSFLPGIIAGFYLDMPLQVLFWIISLLMPVFILAYYRARKQIFPDAFFGILVFLVIFILGFLTASLHVPGNRSLHYIKAKVNLQETLLQARIAEKLKPTRYNQRYIIRAEAFRTEHQEARLTEGKLLLSTEKDATEFQVGDVLLLPYRPSDINSPLNPYQFDYKNYMEKQAVLKQLRINSAKILKINESSSPISFAENLRERIIKKLQAASFSEAEQSIIQALLLGQRRDISRKIYDQYGAAGAVHILAVSGLHVGIILLILNILLKPLESIKHGRLLKTILLLLLIWGFAHLAGLSPSVVRAVSMFSFVAVGMQLKRKTSVMNSLFISLFVLLLINPYFIFQVGFQLSYLAVFSIVAFQPFLYRLIRPKFKLIKYMWGLLTVSVAAQLGVLPLSLFYFHQFPSLFFLSNLVILPALGIILGLGILVILLSLLNFLPDQLAEIYGQLISYMNQFIGWVAVQEDFLFNEISFSILQSITAYFIILALFYLLIQKTYRTFVFLFLGIISFQLSSIYEKQKHFSEEAVIFHKSRNNLIGLYQNRNLQLYHNPDSLAAAQRIISDYKTGKNITETETDTIKNVLRFRDKNLLIIDSSGIYDIPNLEPDLLLITQSPKINLERVLNLVNPSQVIADGSNYNSFVARWEETCRKQKVPFHHTGRKGAFRIFTEPKALYQLTLKL
ncbi:MAG: ComEC/Rec2 family competence protein [Salegentibacter sp.]|uniref:ComEC/Rec2 family competence protein n=1 Tax=Salegentibacter sp. TaxID=1903072 RepID=UPI00286FE209|nr:ComEC/Rec2 family competence protein [Salegentibacter sp.]MDR9457093.1 ComEC/Rec2 family competence protein [Salegentibacter sp.]